MSHEPWSMSFTVRGVAVPQGSMRAYPVTRKTGKRGVAVTHSASAKLRAWREAIAWSARATGAGPIAGDAAVRLALEFVLPRPRAHYDRAGALKATHRDDEHTVRPDLDKLVRAVLDALTGIAYADDAQVMSLIARKWWAGPHEFPALSVYAEEWP